MEEVTQAEPVKGKRWRSWFAHLALFVFLLFFFGWLMLGYGGMLEAPLRLAVGWAFHGGAMLPPLLPRWMELLRPLACFALAMWLTHRFIRWYLVAKQAATSWNPRQTLAASSLLLLGSAAAIAMSGIVHQAVWLGGESWFANRGLDSVQGIRATDQAHQIVKELRMHEIRNGSYPESLAELNLPPRALLLPPRRSGIPEPFTYLKPAAAPAAGTVVPLLVAPALPHRDTLLVGFSSGEIRNVSPDELSKILDAWRSPPVKDDE